MNFSRLNRLFLLVIVILSVSSLLSACGKTGDLYLPDEPVDQSVKNK